MLFSLFYGHKKQRNISKCENVSIIQSVGAGWMDFQDQINIYPSLVCVHTHTHTSNLESAAVTWLLFVFENNGVEKQTEARSTAVPLFCQPDSSWRRWCVWMSGGGGWRSRVWDLGSDRRRRGGGRAPCTGASLACAPPAAARWHQRTVTMSHWQELCSSTKTADYFYCHAFKFQYIYYFLLPTFTTFSK